MNYENAFVKNRSLVAPRSNCVRRRLPGHPFLALGRIEPRLQIGLAIEAQDRDVVLLHAGYRRLEAIALALFPTDAGERMRHGTLRAQLLLFRQIVLDLDAREVCRDGLAASGVWAFVRRDFRL